MPLRKSLNNLVVCGLVWRVVSMVSLVACFCLGGGLEGKALGEPALTPKNVNRLGQIDLQIGENEKWWGGAVVDGPLMPYGSARFTYDQLGNDKTNQAQPLWISNQGRYLWCEEPIDFEMKEGRMVASSRFAPVLTGKAGSTLRDAFLYVSKQYFPPSGTLPAPLLFTRPQYNTWIELLYNQNEKDIRKYARDIVRHGFPPGVLMIDDTWQEDYGTWEFSANRFDDPKEMIEELHSLGFKVMLWVCPFVSPDSPVYRKLKQSGGLLCEDEARTEPVIVRWWNGASALLDLSHPEGMRWYTEQLDRLADKYGVDGFKLDAGDAEFYTGEVYSYVPGNANRQTELHAAVGLKYPLNEYRACWKMAGQALAQRLRDKNHTWEDLQTLVPCSVAQGLLGYAFTCPDMIGGGDYQSFLDQSILDQELVVRSTQCQTLMPMMQFSVAPWRILTKENLAICQKMARLHETMGSEILAMAHESAKTGEPMVRHMEYQFPHQGFAEIKDQFMLGSDILVAPVVEKGATSRFISFPEGRWKGDDGSVVVGPVQLEIDAPLDRLPWFRRQ